jgi:hypothetical protein
MLWNCVRAMSAIFQKADVDRNATNVPFVPDAGIKPTAPEA